MLSRQSQELARRAQAIYQQRLKADLEQAHRDQFVAIEPDSGDHFLGATASEAVSAARAAYPDKLSHLIRIGHEATYHLGSTR